MMFRTLALIIFIPYAAAAADYKTGSIDVNIPQSFALFEEGQLEQRRSYIEAKKQIADARRDLAEIRRGACLALVQLENVIDRSVYIGESANSLRRSGVNIDDCITSD